MSLDRSVIAIDPGYDRVGVAIFSNDKKLLHSECIVPDTKVFSERLVFLKKRIHELIHEFKPTSAALETIFFSKNQKTAIKVAEARGALLVSCAELGLSVYEYSPQDVKIAVTGQGNADKGAITLMVSRLLKINAEKKIDDELDAMALGIAHQAGMALSTKVST